MGPRLRAGYAAVRASRAKRDAQPHDLKPFEMMFGSMYGDAAEASGFVSAENTFVILLTCLRKADKALLYVKTTQNNTPAPHNAVAKKDNSGGNNSGGGKKDNKKNKTNGKQMNQTAGSKKQQGNGSNSGNSNGSN